MDIERGSGPFVSVSPHAAHSVRDSLLPLLAVDEADRLREEDPFTGLLAAVCPNRLVPRRSRFEVDFNRAARAAVYQRPEDAWGLRVWRALPDERSIAKSMREYRAFYGALREMLEELEQRYGKFVVLDLHSYNHRRAGPGSEPADPEVNPEVNVGTGSLDRERWGSVVDSFIDGLRSFDFLGRHLDVRENVRFQGGHLCQWVHEQFPVTGCALAVEFKKFFMDEWTGGVDDTVLAAIHDALASTLPGMRKALEKC
jgi:hypothetical protein